MSAFAPKFTVGHMLPIINRFDFAAVAEFERSRPDLFRDVTPMPEKRVWTDDAGAQMFAFNAIFASEHGPKLRELIKEIKSRVEAEQE